MNADISRQIFEARKHYSGVIEQQGRVLLDAEWNEQGDIQRHHDELALTDVVGHTGFPRVAPGFEITAAGGSFTIGAGRGYVEGILLANDEAVAFTAQPDLPAEAAVLPGQAGRFLVYLDVWRRLVTYLDDPAIREVAVGVDTTARLKTVWQVKWLGVPAGSTCETLGDSWRPAAPAGTLMAQTVAPPASGDPCALPPAAGYRRLENQLYRVEVHRGGTAADATFKWSRENGAVFTAITDISGQVLTVDSTGKDDYLGFHPLDWVEICTDATELGAIPDPNNAGQFLDQHGYLVLIEDVDPNLRQITISTQTPLPALANSDLARLHTKLRRWEQRGTSATADGVALASGWIDLEDGVQVQFDMGATATYRSGDYWLIPARTASDATSGGIEWEWDQTTTPPTPLPLPPFGVAHTYAPLALVDFGAQGGFTVIQDGDCRPIFPPLTGITASDVSFDDTNCQLGNAKTVQEAIDALCIRQSGTCTINLTPSPDWYKAFDQIAENQDALICFTVGTYLYEGKEPIVIKGKGHLVLSGSGKGTALKATNYEAALIFDQCASVTVRDLYAESDVSAVLKDNARVEIGNLNGVLSFRNCRAVTVEHVSVRCPVDTRRAAAGLSVFNATPQDKQGATSSARVVHCDVKVGDGQVGILLVSVARSYVEDNFIRVMEQAGRPVLVKDPVFLGAIRRRLASDFVLGPAEGAKLGRTNATVIYGNQVVHLLTDPSLTTKDRNVNEWQRIIDAQKPAHINTSKALRDYLVKSIAQFIVDPSRIEVSPALRKRIDTLFVANESLAAMSQGITVGGELANEVHIINNTIRGAVQGIHIGLSRRELQRGQPESADSVWIQNNAVQINLPASATRERHGIFVGNCASLRVEDNVVRVQRVARTQGLPIEGLRIFGYIGRLLVVRQNHFEEFGTGINFSPLDVSVAKPQWIITDNLALHASTVVVVNSPVKNIPAATIRKRVRGVDDNYA